MKAQLKNGKWVEIDTSILFHVQYNTMDGKRIFDRDIKRIVDDERPGMGRCRYCGAMVKRGEEEKHFQERESGSCAGCFWYCNRVIDRQSKTAVEVKDGEKITVKTTVEKFEKYCEYTRAEAVKRLKEYRENSCGRFAVRLVKHRERKAV